MEARYRKELRRKCEGNSLSLKLRKGDEPSKKGCEVRRDGRIYVDNIPIGYIVSINEEDQEEIVTKNEIEDLHENAEELPPRSKKRKKTEEKIEELEEEQKEKKEKKKKKNFLKTTLDYIVNFNSEVRTTIRPFLTYYPPERKDLQGLLLRHKFYTKDTVIAIINSIMYHNVFTDMINLPAGSKAALEILQTKFVKHLSDIITDNTPLEMDLDQFNAIMNTEHGNLIKILKKLDTIHGQSKNMNVWDNLPNTNDAILPFSAEEEEKKEDYEQLWLRSCNRPFLQTLCLTVRKSYEPAESLGNIYGRTLVVGESKLLMDLEHRLIQLIFPEDTFGMVSISGRTWSDSQVIFLDTYKFETNSFFGYPIYTGLFEISDDKDEVNAAIHQVIWKTRPIEQPPEGCVYFWNEKHEKYFFSFELIALREIQPGEPIIVLGVDNIADVELDYTIMEPPDEEPTHQEPPPQEPERPPLSPTRFEPPEELPTDIGSLSPLRLSPRESPERESPEREPSPEPIVYVTPKLNEVVEWERKPGEWVMVIIKTNQLEGKNIVHEVHKKSKNNKGDTIFTSTYTEVGDKFRKAPLHEAGEFLEEYQDSETSKNLSKTRRRF